MGSGYDTAVWSQKAVKQCIKQGRVGGAFRVYIVGSLGRLTCLRHKLVSQALTRQVVDGWCRGWPTGSRLSAPTTASLFASQPSVGATWPRLPIKQRGTHYSSCKRPAASLHSRMHLCLTPGLTWGQATHCGNPSRNIQPNIIQSDFAPLLISSFFLFVDPA